MTVKKALRALNNAILDLQAADFNTYERPLQRMGIALADPALAPVVKDLTDRADFDKFLDNAHKGGGMMGSARLNWPAEEAETLGLVILLIERAASDPNWFSNLAHRYYYSPNGKIIGDIRKITTAVFIPFNRDFATYVEEHPISEQTRMGSEATVKSEDKHDLLAALCEVGRETGERPSAQQARLKLLPEWDAARLDDAVGALLDDGDILNPTGAMVHVDIASHARKRIEADTAGGRSNVTYNIGNVSNSPIQHIEAFGQGTQNTSYDVDDLAGIVEIYRLHVESLGLDMAQRRRADAQVATIEAQLLDQPDPTIIQKAGSSLKAIVEGAIGGAAGNALATAPVWAPLLTLF
ncbi:MAG: hypothetical protein ACX930_03705 [Erythrobacter sp.]